jgi:hypothetical protein
MLSNHLPALPPIPTPLEWALLPALPPTPLPALPPKTLLATSTVLAVADTTIPAQPTQLALPILLAPSPTPPLPTPLSAPLPAPQSTPLPVWTTRLLAMMKAEQETMWQHHVVENVVLIILCSA